MAGPPSTGMEKTEMKSLLNKAAPENPINFAFGQGKESSIALLKMDKIKNPKACDKMLSEEFSDAKNTRWGTLIVDPAVNSSLVKFTVNKPVSGMAKRLVKTLKGTGYNKVEIVLEDGTVVEGAADEEQEGVETQGQESVPGGPTTSTAPPPPPPPQPTTPQHSLADLQKALAALIPRIGPTAGENAEFRARLMKFATDANINLKTNNLTYAAAAIGQLAKALESAPPPQQSGAPGGNASASNFAKSRMIWLATQKKVIADIEKLGAELQATYKDESAAGEIVKSYQSVVSPVLSTVRLNLEANIDDVMNAPPEQKPALIQQLRTNIEVVSKIAEAPIVKELDNNPFMPMTIAKSLAASLNAISSSAH